MYVYPHLRENLTLLFSLSMTRRPVRTRKRNSMLSTRSMSIVSSEEGEASEYISSQRSTIESDPELRPTFVLKDTKSSTIKLEISGEKMTD